LYSVDGNVVLGVKLAGEELDFSQVGFKHFTLRSHPLFDVPTLEFELIDPSGYFGENRYLADGIRVEVYLSSARTSDNDYVPFRVFRCSRLDAGSTAQRYVVSCYYDAPSFLFGQRSVSYASRTSSDVVKAIAAEVGMFPDVDPANDVMTWRCASKTLARFLAEDVVTRAYLDQSSVFAMAASHVSKKVLFKNLSSAIRKTPDFLISDNPSDRPDYLLSEKEPTSMSGLFNVAGGGYGLECTGYSLASNSFQTFRGLSVAKSGGRLQIQSDLVGSKARQVYSPIDVGNVHPNYMRAAGQNARALATYSNQVDVLIRGYTKIDLFDVVSLRTKRVQGQTGFDEIQSSNYICVGRAQIATRSEYAERISLVTNTINVLDGGLT
jgi:hypothetical protein